MNRSKDTYEALGASVHDEVETASAPVIYFEHAGSEQDEHAPETRGTLVEIFPAHVDVYLGDPGHPIVVGQISGSSTERAAAVAALPQLRQLLEAVVTAHAAAEKLR